MSHELPGATRGVIELICVHLESIEAVMSVIFFLVLVKLSIKSY